ncbi:hypothetical protein TU62_07490 [Bacillus cereus]|nr:hypothetical protein TU62_07490 [Bacillus cereus]
MKKLGYVEPENKNVFQYIVDDDIEEKPTDELLLTLKTSDKIDYSQFESKELDRLYALIQFIQKSNKKITKLEIEDYNGESIGLPFHNVQKAITKEELYNKEFNIFLRNKDGTSYSLWLSSEKIKKSNNIEELVK